MSPISRRLWKLIEQDRKKAAEQSVQKAEQVTEHTEGGRQSEAQSVETQTHHTREKVGQPNTRHGRKASAATLTACQLTPPVPMSAIPHQQQQSARASALPSHRGASSAAALQQLMS